MTPPRSGKTLEMMRRIAALMAQTQPQGPQEAPHPTMRRNVYPARCCVTGERLPPKCGWVRQLGDRQSEVYSPLGWNLKTMAEAAGLPVPRAARGRRKRPSGI